MISSRVALTSLLFLGLSGCGHSADKDKQEGDKKEGDKKTAISKEKLVGVWEFSEDKRFSLIFDLTKDGKFKGKQTNRGKTEVFPEGNWSLKDDQLSIVHGKGTDEQKPSYTIKSVDDDKLVMFDNADAKKTELVFTRKMDKK